MTSKDNPGLGDRCNHLSCFHKKINYQYNLSKLVLFVYRISLRGFIVSSNHIRACQSLCSNHERNSGSIALLSFGINVRAEFGKVLWIKHFLNRQQYKMYSQEEQRAAGVLTLNAQQSDFDKLYLFIFITDVYVKPGELVTRAGSPRPVLPIQIFLISMFSVWHSRTKSRNQNQEHYRNDPVQQHLLYRIILLKPW